MKKWLGSVAFAALCANGALAADLPRRGPAVAPAPVYVAPIFTWSGFYVGANLGVGFGGDDRGLRAYTTDGASEWFVNDFNSVHSDRGDRTSFTGGVQAGYNWQFGAMVFGIEADINARGAGGRSNYTVTDVDGFAGDNIDVRTSRGGNWFGTVRPRIGVAMDRTLLYVTAGLAYGGSRKGGAVYYYGDTNGNDRYDAGVDDLYDTWRSSRSSSRFGWTVGAGVEHAFSNNLSLKLEYLYVDLDRGNTTYTNPDWTAVTFRGGSDNFHVVRAGLNWRFGGPAYSAGGPVVAAY